MSAQSVSNHLQGLIGSFTGGGALPQVTDAWSPQRGQDFLTGLQLQHEHEQTLAAGQQAHEVNLYGAGVRASAAERRSTHRNRLEEMTTAASLASGLPKGGSLKFGSGDLSVETSRPRKPRPQPTETQQDTPL